MVSKIREILVEEIERLSDIGNEKENKLKSEN
jgi:hypothetical protein